MTPKTVAVATKLAF